MDFYALLTLYGCDRLFARILISKDSAPVDPLYKVIPNRFLSNTEGLACKDEL